MWNCLRSNAQRELEHIDSLCGVQQFMGVADDGHTAVYSRRCVQTRRFGGTKRHSGQHRSADGYTWLPHPDWDHWFDYTSDDFLVRENKERFSGRG